MKVLVACEYSGIVRDAFIAKGHEAMSCDLLPTDLPGPHYQGDVRDVLDFPWDLMIAHPPCTHLSVSGARYFQGKKMDGRQQSAVSFFMMLAKANIEKIAIENPVCIMSTLWRKPDQTIQPWQFGHPESKATCLWLKNLSPLQSTEIVEPEWYMNAGAPLFGEPPTVYRDKGRRYANQTASGQNKLPPSPERWKIRSMTYKGIAEAMAEQWR